MAARTSTSTAPAKPDDQQPPPTTEPDPAATPAPPAPDPEPDAKAPTTKREAKAADEAPAKRGAVDDAYIDALYREREGYTRYGRKDRASEVAAELKRLGAPLERAVTAPPERA
ncbi:hypothetical protein [Streptomyces sp. H27-C3]|uniref:hypothetical protein n=1 Tax=Streptomyces sp. H27-C3 TaxID=3046305 RepID=UPI0024B9E219|nr:hypothetical protein [Streptomyces sp. H27-C3]MDJ0461558.1 hypothetical protein [Streptomyces sp. H27-C3]